jgi:hypothetical protein
MTPPEAAAVAVVGQAVPRGKGLGKGRGAA